MAFEWRFNGMNAGGPTLSQDAANGMQGYVPNSAFVPAQQYNEQVAGMQQGYNDIHDGALLRDEYRRNMAEIENIKAEIAALERAGIANEGKRLDQLDLQLAANRAGIGDIGNAIAHQNRIITRKQLSQNASEYNLMKDKDKDASEIDSLYIQRAGADPAQQAYYDRMISRLKEQYKTRWKEDYDAGLIIPTGTVAQDEKPMTLVDYDQKLSDAKKLSTDGYLSKAQIDQFRADLESMPKTPERQKRLDELNKLVSSEKRAENIARERKAVNAAIDEAMEGYSKGWRLKNGDTDTYTAKNGKVVTVSRINGKLRFSIGKTNKER